MHLHVTHSLNFPIKREWLRTSSFAFFRSKQDLNRGEVHVIRFYGRTVSLKLLF